MKSRQVRDADQQVTALLQRRADLVQDPEQLLRVLEDLVGDDEIEALGAERERFPLDVNPVHVDTPLAEHLRTRIGCLDREQPRVRLHVSRDLQVVASARTDVEHRVIRTRALQEQAHARAAIVERAVDHAFTAKHSRNLSTSPAHPQARSRVVARVRELAGEYTPPEFAEIPHPDAALFMCAIDHRTGYRRGYLVGGKGPYEGSALLWALGCARSVGDPTP